LLTADLVHVRRRGDTLSLVPLAPAEEARALALAEAYIGLCQAHLGRERGRLLEACRQVPVAARERRLSGGLLKLVLDRCEFEESAGLEPSALRAELFERAAAHRRALAPRVTFAREAVLAELAAARGVTAEDLDRALYADLPDAHLLRGADLPGPRSLLAAYQQGGVQAVLLRAASVRVQVRKAPPEAFRALFRKLKFLRLLHRIEPLPAARARGEPAGYQIVIDGPFSLFESVTKYGLQLALAFPAIAACGRWSLEADLRWGHDRRPLRFLARGEAEGAEGDSAPPPVAPEIAALLEDLTALRSGWRGRPAEKVLDLPGLGVCVPDLELTHGKSGKTVYLEVLGFWSRDAVWRRIELAERGLPVPMVFAVSKHLRVSEAALPEEVPAALYVYARTISARALVERVEDVARRA
jgi:predicted nuclease of restriction endonuclease-like RecB superfamily